MKKLLETLYITTPESYLFERNGNICISIGGAEKAAVPITQVNSIVLFGKNTLSTALLSFCSQNDVTITFLSENGFFLGRLCGPVSGNVLLRKRMKHWQIQPLPTGLSRICCSVSCETADLCWCGMPVLPLMKQKRAALLRRQLI